MANTRDIRRRIKSVKNTAQITKAMQMVAASKMRRAQQQALAGRPYAQLLAEITGNLTAGGGEVSHPLLAARPIKKRAVLVISTDKGLCGALNTNLLREVMVHDKPENVYVTIGKKGRQFLARMNKTILADFELKDNFTFRDSKRVSQYLLDLFDKGEVDAVDIYYSKFINTLAQKPTKAAVVPVGLESAVPEAEKASSGSSDYLFEPDPGSLLGAMLPFHVHLQTYQAVIDSRASEHSARMVAMKSATDNAKAMVKDLTLEYNKVRQASITTELLEISSAAAALG
jgi:F-type H+-transporting ATPase subunit gamma